MLFLYFILLLACLALFVGGVIEQRTHDRNLARIPQRVLVNGIRGKSSITRLCAGALRGGGKTVVAKTTGTAARFIFPDATEEPVYRKFNIANVEEQIGIVRRAAAYHPDALVIECMAVMPALQEINQEKLIKSTIGVLCNVREDHLAEMGPTLDDVARSLSRSMPIGGICVTAEQERLHILKHEAAKRNCELISVDPETVTDAEMAGFRWLTFKENVAIALEVAALLGVSRGEAISGMWATPPDPGALKVDPFVLHGRRIRFANVFAANDPESTLMNIEQLQKQGLIGESFFLVINCRPDRVERNGQMGTMVAQANPVGTIIIGDPTRSARVKIDGRWQNNILEMGGRVEAKLMLRRIAEFVPDGASIVAVGNIHGQGEILLHALDALPRWDPAAFRPPAQRRPDGVMYR